MERLQAFLVEHGVDPAAFARLVAALDTDVYARGAPTESIEPAEPDGQATPEKPGDPLPVRVDLLGQGGMALVWRARDAALDRTLAMKILREHLRVRPDMCQRLVDEARLTARLAHPSIPAVHAIGTEGGLPWFTMKEVRGKTLHDVIVEVHSGRPSDPTWTMGRLLDAFQRVCEATAFAHANGVIHCDLKPTNIMVGAFGEVMVMDWGVARIATDVESRRVWRGLGGSSVVSGTPGYMPPEQAKGRVNQISPAADVYALGVILYVILQGERPFTQPRGEPMVRQQVEMAFAPITATLVGFRPDDAVRAIVAKALQAKVGDRYSDAGVLAAEFAAWREGSKRRERALADVRRAERALPGVLAQQRQARDLRDVATALLAALPPDASAEAKVPAWTIDDEAATVERSADRNLGELVNQLRGALAQAPDLPEANRLLAAIHRDGHAEAERQRDWREATRHEALVRAYDDGTLARWLDGTSRVSVASEPPARAHLARYVERGRRLVPEAVRDLGTTPIAIDLPIGSYVVELVAGDRAPVRLPLAVGRFEELDAGVVAVPGDLSGDDLYVPSGECALGGDPLAPGSRPAQRVVVDAFVIRRLPVVFSELFEFLAEPGAAEARRAVFRSGVTVFRADRPACGVPWAVATAFARWMAARTGQPWRLPTDIEWEKAARGVDGRWFPWGDLSDPAFAHVRAGGANAPRSVYAHPLDVSPYGVLGMAGNVREWCADAWRADDEGVRVVRGGSWRTPVEASRCAARAGLAASIGHADVGFRLVRSA